VRKLVVEVTSGVGVITSVVVLVVCPEVVVLVLVLVDVVVVLF